MERLGHSVPATLREEYVLADGFAAHLKHRGWTLFEHRPIYTDQEVICQRWLKAPSGRAYSDRDFYHLFAEWNFRAALRALLGSPRVTVDQLVVACPEATKRASYLAFLHDQEMLLYAKAGYGRGPTLEGI
jgi:hypothetical protein